MQREDLHEGGDYKDQQAEDAEDDKYWDSLGLATAPKFDFCSEESENFFRNSLDGQGVGYLVGSQ